VGLGLVVTRDGGIPLVSHCYPGNKPDVAQFATMPDTLTARHGALVPQSTEPRVTVVFDAGQNSVANFAHLAMGTLHFVGSVPPSDCPDLLSLPARRRTVVDEGLLPGVSAYDTRRTVYEREHRVVLTHSATLHAAQARGFEQTPAKAGARLTELAETLARGKTRRTRDKVEAEIGSICHDTWARRVITWTLAGESPAEYRLTWAIDKKAKTALAREIFGKRVLATDREDWSVAEVICAYRSQSEAEFSFRQLKDPHTVSFSPMYHWTDHNIRIHVFTCVLALQAAHLMRREAQRAGREMSVRALLASLAGIQETVMIYLTGQRGRPKAHRLLTDQDPEQRALTEIFDLARWAPLTA
jgi:transposase